ncbi:MAG: hypothetical protein IPK16_29285 [Anaerolineales bacterium]|nr:hypothetical protein [Anaerolineales bacterium]
MDAGSQRQCAGDCGLLRLRYRRIPAAPVVLVYGILVVSLFNLSERGVSVVGAVPQGLPQLTWPAFGRHDLLYLIVGALGIFFLAVGESLGTARAYAAKYDYSIDANQELIALGAANIGTGLFQGFTVDASLSQTATAEQAGSKTQLSSLVSAILILLTLVFLAAIFQNLPSAVLAVVVMNSVISLMDVKELRRYYTVRRPDFVLALVALLGCPDRCADRAGHCGGVVADLHRLPRQPALHCAARPRAAQPE